MIPKSLHTVSVLVAVANAVPVMLPIGILGTTAELVARVDNAARLLGYADAPDTYALKAAAVRKLEKAQRS